jgi:hypothetical protein
MRITLLILLTILWIPSFGQNITYDLPQGYENLISQNDYKKIVDASVAIVGKKYTIDFVKGGTVQLTKGQDVKLFNLDNLISKCIAETDKALWNRIIQSHFEQVFAVMDEQRKIDPANYETVKQYLSLRIYPKQTVVARGGIGNLIVKADLEDTYTVLMLDLPDAFTPIQKEMFDEWKKDTAEVFKIAQDNVNKQQIEKVTQTFDIDGTNVEISFLGNEDYAASFALALIHNSPELVGEWGSVVAIPNKGLVNVCKITKDKPLDFVKFIQRTKPLVEKAFMQHEQPISPDYFWYYQGRFAKIMILTNANGGIQVISPFGLTALMTPKN